MNKGFTLRRFLEFGGIVAGVVLIAFGVAAVALGASGKSTVQSNLKHEYIVGTPDMTPQAIAPEVKDILAAQKKIAAAQVKAGVPVAQRIVLTPVTAPSCSVAGKLVDSGSRARCFAQYMRIHALGGSNGLVYAQMGRYTAKPGAPVGLTDFNGGTNDTKYALIDPKTSQPVSNGIRNLWVTETALTSALNLGYTAEQVSIFGIVVGVALLLSGIGFLILAIAVLHQPFRAKEEEDVREPATTLKPTPAL